MTPRLADPSPRRLDGEQGFTLVELLASLVIVAVVMALLGSSVRTLAASWDRQITRLEDSDVLARSISVFRRDVRSLRQFSTGAARDQKLAFAGRARSVTFVSSTVRAPSDRGLTVINYSFRRNGRFLQLIRRTGQFKTGVPVSNVALRNPVVLVDGLSGGTLSYRGLVAKKTGWTRNWRDLASLPDVVRLRLRLPSSPSPPAIITRIRSNIDQICTVSKVERCSPKANQGQSAQSRNSRARASE